MARLLKAPQTGSDHHGKKLDSLRMHRIVLVFSNLSKEAEDWVRIIMDVLTLSFHTIRKTYFSLTGTKKK